MTDASDLKQCIPATKKYLNELYRSVVHGRNKRITSTDETVSGEGKRSAVHGTIITQNTVPCGLPMLSVDRLIKREEPSHVKW